MSINWRVRMKSPAFWLDIAGAAATPPCSRTWAWATRA